MKTYSDGSDLVVALDAFKITRHGVDPVYGETTRWRVIPLTPWARDLLRQIDAHAIGDGMAIANCPDGFITPARGDLDQGVGFERRKDALMFIATIERSYEET